MMEKIISEFRVIETDDGFRIEIKGDKEKIKSFMTGFGRRQRGPHWHARHRRGPGGPFGFAFGPWTSCWGAWDVDESEEENASKV
jgi:hypothetical protein